MAILELLKAAEAGGHWGRFFLIGVPMDVVTLAVLIHTVGGLVWRYSDRDRDWTGIKVASGTAILFFLYCFALRPLLVTQVAFRALPYLAIATMALFVVPVLFAEDSDEAWMRLRRLAADFTPDLTPRFLWWSVVTGMILLALVTPRSIGHWAWPAAWRSPWLNILARSILDAGLLQILTVITLLTATYHYYQATRGRHFARSTAASPALNTFFLVAVIGVALVAATVAVFAARSSFNEVPVADALTSSRLTQYVTELLNLSLDNRAQAPSGFATRQAILLLLSVLLTQQPYWRKVFSRRTRLFFISAMWVMSLLVVADRLYIGHSTLRSAGVGIAVGVMLFWWLAPGAVYATKATTEHYRLFIPAIAPLALYTVGIWIACENKALWAFISAMLYLYYGAIYLAVRLSRFHSPQPSTA